MPKSKEIIMRTKRNTHHQKRSWGCQLSSSMSSKQPTITIRRCLVALLFSCLIAIYQIYTIVGSASTNLDNRQQQQRSLWGHSHPISGNSDNNDNISFCCIPQDTKNNLDNGDIEHHPCSLETSKICWKGKNENDDKNKINKNRENSDGNTKQLTVALMYYAEPAMLVRQLDNFMSYPDELKEKFTLLIVDDGSPDPSLSAKTYVSNNKKYVTISSNNKLDIRVAYIKQNILWNTPGARNLAFHVAETPTVLMIDSDLIIPQETMEKALTWKTRRPQLASKLADPSSIHSGFIGHQFNRTKPNNGGYKIHPSAMLMDVESFWEVGGFEEDFAGNYGNEDVAFWYRYKDKKQHPRNLHMEHKWALLEQFDEDDPCNPQILSTPQLVESCRNASKQLPKLRRQPEINEAKFRRRRETKNWSNSYLRFPWKMVYP